MSIRSSLLFLSLGLLLAAAPAHTEDWPQWRGPQRTGHSPEKGLLSAWPAGGPKLVWQVNDLGEGYGAPAIAGGKLYILSNRGMDNEYLEARDLKTGAKLWSSRIGKVGKPDQQPNYPAARSTPTIDGAHIYALSSDGDLVCLEASSGAMVWTRNLPAQYGGKSGTWAYAESPLVDGDLVLCTPGGSDATILALDKKSGTIAWKAPIPGGDDACYSSIVATTIGGVKQYVQQLRTALVGVEAKSGKFLWRFEKTAAPNVGGYIATPVVSDDLIYSCTGLTGGGLAKISLAEGKYSAESLYFARKLPNAIGGAVRVGDYLYGTGGQTLMCVEFKTGKVLWEERGIGVGSICYADGKLFVHGENNDLAMVEATPDGYREKGRVTPPSPPERGTARAWAYPALANGKLFVRERNVLWCYDIKGK